MAIDKIRPLGLETPVEGGTESAPYPTEFDPTEDHVSVKGVAFEGNDVAVAWADSGVMKFKDTALSEKTLTQIYNGKPVTRQHIIHVDKEGNDISGDGSLSSPYLTIAKAITTITDSSETNRYLILVAPGIYTEAQLNMPEYTSINGSTIQSVVVEPDASNHHVFNLSIGCEVSFLTIQNAGSGYAGINSENTGDFTQSHKVSFYDCDININVFSSTTETIHYSEYCDFNGTFSYGGKCVATNNIKAVLNFDSIYTFPTECTVSHLYATGVHSALHIMSAVLYGDETAVDVLITVSNGTDLQATSIVLYEGGTGLIVETGANEVEIESLGLICKSLVNDVHIYATNANGYINGAWDKEKYLNNSPNSVHCTYQDYDDGDFNITRILATRGFATDLTTVTTANQTTQMVSYDAHTYVLTGSTSGQILKLPDSTTLRIGHRFHIMNESAVSVTIQDYSGGDSEILSPESNTLKILRDNSTTAGVWTKSVSQNYAIGKLRDPRTFNMNGTVGDGNWISVSELIPSFKYIFTEAVKLVAIEWSNRNGAGRDFDLLFYKNGIDAGNLLYTYQVRNSTYDYASQTGLSYTFTNGDYMRVKYVDQGNNVSDFAGRFVFEVLT